MCRSRLRLRTGTSESAGGPPVTVETFIQQALTRARGEQEQIVEKRDAFETFASRVEDIPAESPQPQGARPGAPTGDTLTTRAHVTTTGTTDTDRCRSVREAFARTVRSHSVEDVDASESLLTTVAAELTDDIAAALAPAESMQTRAFHSVLKQRVLTETTARTRECTVLIDALEREREALRDVNTDVSAVLDWLVEADETPLTSLGFETLRARHETLAAHRNRCDRLAHERQALLDRKTCRGTQLGLTHRSLVTYLYADFPVDHPVLATAVRLDRACAACQRAVRAHLVRRV